MGLGSPSASAKRRMAPRSTSWTTGSLSLPMSVLSSMVLLEPPRGEVQHRGEPAWQHGDAVRGVPDRPRRREVAGEPAAQHGPHRRPGVDLHLVALLLEPRRDDELEAQPLRPVAEPAQDLPQTGHLACPDGYGSVDVALGDHRLDLLLGLVELEPAAVRDEHGGLVEPDVAHVPAIGCGLEL